MKIKNIIVICLITVWLCSLSSCNKDTVGVYNPKKKISAIFYQASGFSKQLYQTWNWDKNQISNIFFADNGCTLIFNYEGKKVIKILDTYFNEYIDFIYDGKTLTQFSYYRDNILEISARVKIEKGKVVELNYEIYHETDVFGNKAMNAKSNIMKYLFPTNEMMKEVCANIDNAQKGYYTIQYKWENDNVVEALFTVNAYTMRQVFTYDDKNNPFYNYFTDCYEEGIVNINWISKNNVISSTTYNGVGVNYESFTYIYGDDKYPTMQIDKNGNAQFYEY